ncbi:hypothetical protein IZY60_05580 [Lutibacter sp. B2]|nr:hypothetical protein [Lutibacter sp. B2]
MGEYFGNLKRAFTKMRKDQTIAGNQLIFKEKEAIVLTGVVMSIPIFGIIFSLVVK